MILGTKIALGLAVLTIVQGAVIMSQANARRQQRAEISQYKETIAQQEIDVATCRRTNTSLREAHGACLAEMRVAEADHEYQRQMVEQLSNSIRQGSQNVRRERQIVYREPSCQELGQMDVAAICPGLALSLRARAAEMSTTRNDRGPHPGGSGIYPDR